MRLEVVPAELRGAARAVGALRRAIESAAVGRQLDAAVATVPGGRLAAAAAGAADGWTRERVRVSAELGRYAGALRAAAARYAEADARASGAS